MTTIAVVGGGAAGLVAAIFAASDGADVLLIERTADGGRKILISGGGRCNVLPSVLAPERFVTDSAGHLLRAMLKAWPLHEQQAFFENDLHIPLALEDESGKLFPASNRARDVRDGLVSFARERGVRFQFGTRVDGLQPDDAGWIVRTSTGDIPAAAVILATGGLSVPATGSDGIGLQVAAGLGHRMIDPYAALTPLLGDTRSRHDALSGVSLHVRLRAKSATGTAEAHGGFLFTHRGYSGPSVLDVSHIVTRTGNATVRAQWSSLDAAAWNREFETPSAPVATLIGRHVPTRLGAQLMLEAGVPADRRTSSLRRTERTSLIECLTSYALPVTGDEGFKKAEVTGGGVALDEVDLRTLESKRHPRLYLCGEILDAFGPIGGHNFAWAWATGRAAGRAAARPSP